MHNTPIYSLQISPRTILSAVGALMPNCSAKAAYVAPSSRTALTCRAVSRLSFLARLGLDDAEKRPPSLACTWFALRVDHSKFSAALFALLKSLWLTSFKSEGGRKCSATSLCTFAPIDVPPVQRVTKRYPSLSLRGFRSLPRLMALPPQRCPTSRSLLRTLPSELTSYRPEKPAIDFQISRFLAWPLHQN